MAAKLPHLPAIPSDLTPSQREFFDALIQYIEVRDGRRGDPMEQNVTFRDLENVGVIQDIPSWVLTQPGGVSRVSGRFSTIKGPPVVTTPPPVADPEALSGIGAVNLVWGPPGYANHGYVEIFRSTTPTINLDIIVGQAQGRFFSDNPPPTEFDPEADPPGRPPYYYWVRNVSNTGIRGPLSQPLEVELRLDPDYVMDQLSGVVASAEDALQLNQRVDDIDAQYSVRVGQEGFVSGFGLISEYDEEAGVAESAFIIRADTFGVVLPNTDMRTVTQMSPSSSGKFYVDLQSAHTDAIEVDNTVVISGSKAHPFIGNFVVTGVLQSGQRIELAIPGDLEGKPLPEGDLSEDNVRLGVSTVPFAIGTVDGKPVVGIDAATIIDLTVEEAAFGTMSGDRIAVNSLDGDRVTANTLDVINATVGNEIMSYNFSSASTPRRGWRLYGGDVNDSGSTDNAKFELYGDAIFGGKLDIGEGSGSRMRLTNESIRIYDGSTLRVHIGNLEDFS